LATETGFEIDWLKERFRFDSDARNQNVEQICIDYFQDDPILNIVDIGSGTGANGLYLIERFSQNQNWTFVELNPALANASIEKVYSFAQEKNYEIEIGKEHLLLQKGEQKIQIRIITESFLELEKHVDLQHTDLLTANAVFDLLNEEMLLALLQKLWQHQVAILSTINYEGMAFWPASKTDPIYIERYEAHMQRPQSFGQALGPQTMPTLIKMCEEHKKLFTAGESNWRIAEMDTTMHQLLLDYLKTGVLDMLETDEDKKDFLLWLQIRQNLARRYALQQMVFHQDIFIPSHHS
jgi:precorrin-6B methylase 2